MGVYSLLLACGKNRTSGPHFRASEQIASTQIFKISFKVAQVVIKNQRQITRKIDRQEMQHFIRAFSNPVMA